jgi:hypothetical protein
MMLYKLHRQPRRRRSSQTAFFFVVAAAFISLINTNGVVVVGVAAYVQPGDGYVSTPTLPADEGALGAIIAAATAAAAAASGGGNTTDHDVGASKTTVATARRFVPRKRAFADRLTRPLDVDEINDNVRGAFMFVHVIRVCLGLFVSNPPSCFLMVI